MPRPEALTVLLAGFLSAGHFFAAAQAADTPDPAQLKALERDVRETAATRDKLQAEHTGIGRDIESIRTDLISTAKDIQEQEHSLTVMEGRLGDLERDAARLTATLTQRDAQMTQVLLALERLALRPADALSLSPLAPADAVRTAILLRAALPHIKESETALQRELAALYAIRTQVTQQKEAAATAAAALVAKRGKLESLEREKAARQVMLASRSEELNSRLAKMAREAQDLRDLFARLAEEKAVREKEEAAKAKAAEAARAAEADKAEKAAKAKPPAPAEHDVAVTRSFAKARGTMPFPVMGTLATRYGEAAGSGEDPASRAKGITITTRGGAQVVAPFDGIVAFAGPFRGYGQLLIIEHSEGYHTLLAGMGHIDAVVGARVLAGEPVGVMDVGIKENVPDAGGGKAGAPSLYVELRRDGQPINPLPWLASAAGKSSG